MPPHVVSIGAALVLLLALGLFVARFAVGGSARRAAARSLFAAFAARHGLTSAPPKNRQDSLAPGKVKGRYRERGVQIWVDDHAGGRAARARGPNTHMQVRAKLQHKIGAELHGGSGGYAAKRGDSVPVPEDLARFRLSAGDVAKAERRLARPGVAQALAELARHGWVRLDDGGVECRLELAGSIEELEASVDLVVHAAEKLEAT